MILRENEMLLGIQKELDSYFSRKISSFLSDKRFADIVPIGVNKQMG